MYWVIPSRLAQSGRHRAMSPPKLREDGVTHVTIVLQILVGVREASRQPVAWTERPCSGMERPPLFADYGAVSR
jgi:hypothetical protein